MLAHKMEDEWLATYVELLKAARQIEKQSQARHPMSLHSQSDGLSNVWATAPSSLFLSHRLKVNYPVVLGRAAAVEGDETGMLEMALSKQAALA